MEIRILVTGSGGIGGVNFVRALRLAERMGKLKYFIVGTDYNQYHILFPDVNLRMRSPRHDDVEFIPFLLDIVRRYDIQFLHPHPSSEAKVVSQNKDKLDELRVKHYLPRPEEIAPDKYTIYEKLRERNVPVPQTLLISSDLEGAFERLGSPLWIRARAGAGGRLSLKVNNPREARAWIELNVMQGRAKPGDFIAQEYLPGRDLAFDSLWYNGKLVTSYARERLEYPFAHISLSGVTGTPTVARIVHDDEVTKVGISAVKALSSKPHGFYSVDIKEDADGKPRVTEVDGKWHTTAPLWGYAFSKFKNDIKYNIAYIYVEIGLNGEVKQDIPEINLFPEELYLIRHIDCGVLLKHKEEVFRVL
ncbi:MAG: ATP-grasp domain-containing protein [Candidatus Methanodesulfokora sp.]